ncbi:MAG: hypothetical protein KF832_12635 [Caldilineaceae bacterium]|nr:hypothetical protein [Caldilineaceae bacterium]
MQTLIAWVADIYRTHGYQAALVTLVVLVGLAVLVAQVAGLSLADLLAWLP